MFLNMLFIWCGTRKYTFPATVAASKPVVVIKREVRIDANLNKNCLFEETAPVLIIMKWTWEAGLNVLKFIYVIKIIKF